MVGDEREIQIEFVFLKYSYVGIYYNVRLLQFCYEVVIFLLGTEQN